MTADIGRRHRKTSGVCTQGRGRRFLLLSRGGCHEPLLPLYQAQYSIDPTIIGGVSKCLVIQGPAFQQDAAEIREYSHLQSDEHIFQLLARRAIASRICLAELSEIAIVLSLHKWRTKAERRFQFLDLSLPAFFSITAIMIFLDPPYQSCCITESACD